MEILSIKYMIWFVRALLTGSLVIFCIGGNAKESIKVNILADDDYPPYSYMKDGKLTGIYVDLVREASVLLEPEYDISMVAMPWKRALMKIETGEELAIIPPYAHVKKRPYIFPYSVPLAEEQVVVFCNKDIKLENVFSLADLPFPINMGINAGYLILNDKYRDAIKKNRIVLRENKSTEANIIKLLKDRIDCYVNDKTTIELGLAKYKVNQYGFEPSNYIEMDFIASQLAYIGYSNTVGKRFPFKNDFVRKMDNALESIILIGQR